MKLNRSRKPTIVIGFAMLGLAGVSLAGCNQATVASAAQTACAVVETAAQTPGLALNANQQAVANAAVASCKATSDGTNLSTQSDTAAIMAAIVMLQPLLANVHLTAEVAASDAPKINKMQRLNLNLVNIARANGFVR